jgi:hypothetical protein
MNCPYCDKPIEMADVRKNRAKYYLDSNMCGIIWHSICINRVLAGWVDGMWYLKITRKRWNDAEKRQL